MKLMLLFTCMLTVGCMAEVGSEETFSLENDYKYPVSDWSGDEGEDSIPVCRSYVQTFEMNGETVSIVRHVNCPLLPSAEFDPSLEDQVDQKGMVQPYDSLFDLENRLENGL